MFFTTVPQQVGGTTSVSDPYSFRTDPDPGSNSPYNKVLVILSMNVQEICHVFIVRWKLHAFIFGKTRENK
jgi:hypothetical protein